MDAVNNAFMQMRAVTISREYGSGGGEIAARLAGRLGWLLIDHQIVVRVANEIGVSTHEAEARDERAEGFLERVLNSALGIDPALMVEAPPEAFTTDEEVYRNALNKVVRAAAARGHVVIVGRGSQILLAQYRDILHVRIVAELEKRVAYVMQREGLERAEARARVQMKDRDRAKYLQAEYHQHPDDPCLYDLVLNTSLLTLDTAVDVICALLQEKARLLAVPPEQLGPAVGTSRYPHQPEDFHPPLPDMML